MTILEGVEVGMGKNNIQVILGGMREVVAVGLDQVQEPLLIDIGLGVLNVGKIIILLRTV